MLTAAHTHHCRAAQRAFRERKQSQLAELQARVQRYEQGEIERNVALQTIAKRLKEENDKLRQENTLLQQKLSAAEEERDCLRNMSRKRWRDDSVPQTPACDVAPPSRKRSRTQPDIMETFGAPTTLSSPSYLSSPATSVVSSPGSNDHTSFSPIPSLPPSRAGPIFPQGNPLTNIFDFIASGKTNLFEPGGALDTFNCGFCNDNTPCVCRELALQQINNLPNSTASYKVEGLENTRGAEFRFDSAQLPTPQPSILENLPAYQPPVPLRRRGGQRTNIAPVFPISQPPLSSVTQNPASCTGDPSNCPACADDAFGKAFCAALNKSVETPAPVCGSCPCGAEGGCSHSLPSAASTSSSASCCGNPGSCCRARESFTSSASMVAGPSSFALADLPSLSHAAPSSAPGFCGPQQPSQESGQPNTIPCDDAWRQIKSHPNVAFADLDLLAEVVARRTKCTGPRVEIFPAPGSITPERGISPITMFSQQRPGSSGSQPIVPHQHRFAMPSSSPAMPRLGESERGEAPPSLQLVPQEVLAQCGQRQRVREVDADSVRDALRLLDSKFSMS
jgi:AP-1-like transcription factor